MMGHMDHYELDLEKRFRALSDDQLRARCEAGNLTAIGQAVADREMAARGLDQAHVADDELLNGDGDYAAIGSFLDPMQARIVRAMLVAAGMPAFVADANLAQTNLLWALGGTRVLVPRARLAEAEDIVAAFDRGDFALPEGEYWQE